MSRPAPPDPPIQTLVNPDTAVMLMPPDSHSPTPTPPLGTAFRRLLRARRRSQTRASAATDPSSHLRTPTTSRGSVLSYLHNLHLELPRMSSRRSISSGRSSSSSRSRRISVYGPRELPDEFHMFQKKDKREAVLARIEKIYSQSIFFKNSQSNQDKDRLDSGYCCCLGLLDPVTNIRINGIIYDAKAAQPGKGGDMAERSLEGLISFLTCLFPYLPDAEALAYLDAANADPLVAARLIVRRRGLRDFDVSSSATVDLVETALRHAAVAAQHPDPQLLVVGWKSISAGLANFPSHLSGPLSDGNAIGRVIRLIQTPIDNLGLRESWELARGRLERLDPIGKELPPVRAAMKQMLLATIHGFYLKALGSLPSNELTHRYHRSLLLGGYCYGPLHPVENIIVNTIWYEQNFPSSKGFKTFMISTSCLWQVAARSMYGLISFLCTRYPGLTPDLALQRLLMAGANLRKADPSLIIKNTRRVAEELDWSEAPQIVSGMDTASMQKRAVHKRAARVTVPEAYVAAATAAFHPSPAAQKEFLASPDCVERLEHISYVLLRYVHDGNQIPTYQFRMLCTEVSKCLSSVGMSHQPQEREPIEINKSFYCLISQRIGRFWDQHSRVFIKSKVALEEFNKITASNYQFHVICGVNELVCGPHFCPSTDARGYKPYWLPYKYNLSHVNFLATTIDDSGNDIPTLFFAEFNNHGPDTWCVPIDWPSSFAEKNRCVYCEDEGDRIVHPAKHGRPDFELYLNDSVYTNDNIIIKRKERVTGVDDGGIYSSYRVRPDCGDEDSARWRVQLMPPCC